MNSRFHSWTKVPLPSRFIHFTIKTIYLFNFINMNVCLHISECTMYIEDGFRDQKRVVDPLELKIQMILSFCVDIGNWTQIFCKSSMSSEPLSHLVHILNNCLLYYQQPTELVGKPLPLFNFWSDMACRMRFLYSSNLW